MLTGLYAANPQTRYLWNTGYTGIDPLFANPLSNGYIHIEH